MASARQMAANRASAKKSSGPRSLAGKAITRLSAVRNGLTAQLLVIVPEERATFISFSQKLTASLNPIGIEELRISARIVRNTWGIHRIAYNEETAYSFGLMEVGLMENDADSTINVKGAADIPAVGAASGEASHALKVAIGNSLTFGTRASEFDRASLIEARLRRGLHKDHALLHHLQKERNRPATCAVRPTWKPDSS